MSNLNNELSELLNQEKHVLPSINSIQLYPTSIIPFFDKINSWSEKNSDFIFSKCPYCNHVLKGKFPPRSTNSPFWLTPGIILKSVSFCEHFRVLGYAIHLNHNQIQGGQWLLPLGRGTPGITASLAEDDALRITVRETVLEDGSIVYWCGYYTMEKYLITNSSLTPLNPVLLNYRYYIESDGLTEDSFFPIFDDEIYPEIHEKVYQIKVGPDTVDLCSIDSKADISQWKLTDSQYKISLFKGTQAIKDPLYSVRLGMLNAKKYRSTFLGQFPWVLIDKKYSSNHLQSPNPVEADKNKNKASINTQYFSKKQLFEISEFGVMYAIVDPFQSFHAQFFINLVARKNKDSVKLLWSNEKNNISWKLFADEEFENTLLVDDVSRSFWEYSPVIIKVNPEILAMFNDLNLWNRNWGAFFISQSSMDEVHSHLKQLTVCEIDGELQYFRFYDSQFLHHIFRHLQSDQINNFFGLITGWYLTSSTNEPIISYSVSKNIESSPSNLPINISAYMDTITDSLAFESMLPQLEAFILRSHAESLINLEPEISKRWISNLALQAKSYNFCDLQSLAGFVNLAFAIAPNFFNHEQTNKILSNATLTVDEKMGTNGLLGLPEAYWDFIHDQVNFVYFDLQLWQLIQQTKEFKIFHQKMGEYNKSRNFEMIKKLYSDAYNTVKTELNVDLLQSSSLRSLDLCLDKPGFIKEITLSKILVRDEANIFKHVLINNFNFQATNDPFEYVVHFGNFQDMVTLINNLIGYYVFAPYEDWSFYYEAPEELRIMLLSFFEKSFWLIVDEDEFWYLREFRNDFLQ